MAPEQAHPRLPHDSRLPQGQQGAIEKTFREFNRFCYGEELFSKDFVSIDGSKFKAVNAKDRNFTLNKLDDRIACLDRHIACYMEELVACDEEEGRKLSREELEIKLEGCKGRKELYEGYQASPENRCEEGGKLRASSGRKKDGPTEVPLRASLRDAQAVARPILLPVERLRQSHHRDGHVLPISYNMQRAINIKGVPALLAALR